MNLDEAMSFIHCTDWKGSRLGLERIEELLHRLGDPQRRLRFVHVAGTNGKGSICALLSAMLTAAGYRTGLYTSPHLWQLNERMQVCGAEISDEDLIFMAERVKPAVEAMADSPTEFELITAMALLYFQEQGCDIVVLEVGLGGRLDSTNVIPPPEVAVIASLGLEHTEVLGETLEKISAEKAGIIKSGCTAVVYRGAPEVEQVYETVCAREQVALCKARFEAVTVGRPDLTGQTFDWLDLAGLRLGLLGEHQVRNAVVALETILVLRQKGWTIPEEALRQGLAQAKWPARLEVLHEAPLFLVDGAHNPQGTAVLSRNLAALLPETKVVFLLGVLADKQYDEMLTPLLPHAKAFVCLTPDSDRALPAQALAQYLRDQGQDAVACDDAQAGIRTALATAAGAPVVACGSLYLMGAIRQQFRDTFRKWLRSEKIKARDGLAPADRAAYQQALVRRIAESKAFANAHTILSYNAIRGEVNLSELHALAKTLGKKIVYPLCANATELLALDPQDEAAWRTGPFGIQEPDPTSSIKVAPEEIDLVLCPCTSFDAQGNRMGMGAGYYDRYLPLCRRALIAAVAFEAQRALALPTEPWDRPVELVFTEADTYRRNLVV